MPMPLDELIQSIVDATDRIWLDEPPEIRRFREGIFESGAGSYGYAFPNMVFVNGDMRALSTWITPNAVMKALRDDLFTLEHCQRLFAWLNMVNVDFLAYCGFVEMARFCHAIVDHFDEMTSKHDFERVLQVWYAYANRMYLWVHHMFPWAAGATIRTRDRSEIGELGVLSDALGEVKDYFDQMSDSLLEWKTRR
jgi:hypothetical protein